MLANWLNLDKPALRTWVGWLGIGLLIRFCIAPFTAQTDMFAVYWRSAQIAFEGEVFSSYMVNMGAHWVHALWLLITSPVMPTDNLWLNPWWWEQSESLALQFFTDILNRPDVYWILAVLKLPYALADLGTGLLIFLMGSKVSPNRRMLAWIFWMLSPIGLYASYAFGRYEMFAVICVVAALMLFESENYIWSAIILGVGVTMRSYPLLLIPIFAMFVPLRWWAPNTVEANVLAATALNRIRQLVSQLLWVVLAFLPFVGVMAVNKMVGGQLGELETLSQYHTGSTFFAYRISISDPGDIYLFVLFAIMFYVLIFCRSHQLIGSGGLHMSELWVWLTVFHAGLFAFSTFSVHYFAWFVPFVALALMRRPSNRALGLLHAVQIVAVFVLADCVAGPGLTLGLFAPLAPEMVTAAPSLHDLLLTKPDTIEQLAGIARTVFIGVTLIMSWPFAVELYSRAIPVAVKSEEWPRADYVRRSRRGDRRTGREETPELEAVASEGSSPSRNASPSRSGGSRSTGSRSAGSSPRNTASRNATARNTGSHSAGSHGAGRSGQSASDGSPGRKTVRRTTRTFNPQQPKEELRFGSVSSNKPFEPTRVVDAVIEREDFE